MRFAALGAVSIALLWLSLRCITDHCYLYLHGSFSVISTTVLFATWMFIFLAGNKAIKISLLAMTLIAVALIFPTEINISGAASSAAASTLRKTAQTLADLRSRTIAGYPTTVNFAIDDSYQVLRFYNFEYVAIRSDPSGPINSFMLKARPKRYACGIHTAFLVDTKGKIHVTREDRDATEKDSLLD